VVPFCRVVNQAPQIRVLAVSHISASPGGMLHLATKLASAALRGHMSPSELRTLIALSAIGVFGGGYALRASRAGLWSALKALGLLAIAHSSRGLLAAAVQQAFPSLAQRVRELQGGLGQGGVAGDQAQGDGGPRVPTLLGADHGRHQVCVLCGCVVVLLCGCVWLCVAVCGCVWLCVTVCGCVWLCVAVCGCVWLSVTVCGCAALLCGYVAA
jgi:hypothetical protein